MCACVCRHVQQFAALWTVAHQVTPLSWGFFSGKNSEVGCHFLLPGIFQTRGSNPSLLYLLEFQVDSLPSEPSGEPYKLQIGLRASAPGSEFSLLLQDPLGAFEIQDSVFSLWVLRLETSDSTLDLSEHFFPTKTKSPSSCITQRLLAPLFAQHFPLGVGSGSFLCINIFYLFTTKTSFLKHFSWAQNFAGSLRVTGTTRRQLSKGVFLILIQSVHMLLFKSLKKRKQKD